MSDFDTAKGQVRANAARRTDGPVAPESLVSLYLADGSWENQSIQELLSEQLATGADRTILVDNDFPVTTGQILNDALSLANWLQSRGVAPGDTISFQLPNWSEALVIDAAAALIGAISNPIVPIYRDAEVLHILSRSRTKVFFIPESFRSQNYVETTERIREQLSELQDIVVVRGSGALNYRQIIADNEPDRALLDRRTDPNDPRLVMYTSGTTGRAKGVVHSLNTLRCEIRNASEFWALERGDTVLMASPLTHITGYLYGICFPMLLGIRAVLMDRWEASRAADLIERYDVRGTCSASPFLRELIAAARATGQRLPGLRFFACGGAPVPPELIQDGLDAFDNCAVFRMYGSTESPSITLGNMVRGAPEAAVTDGKIVGCHVRILDPHGHALADGCEGEISVKGPELMLGYLDAVDNQRAFTDDGYFRTGDLGVQSSDGYLTITGRLKDIINRGGEKFSAKEIEDAIHRHPSVAEVAVIAVPHERLGEAVCAVVVLAAGQSLSLKEMNEFVSSQGLARQKTPEYLQIVQSMPSTASGKIQKHVLQAGFNKRGEL